MILKHRSLFETLHPTSFQYQRLNTTSQYNLKDEDLHIFVLDNMNLEKSIEILQNCMRKRERLNREMWLIDVSTMESVENATEALNSLDLDIDDDILLFKKQENGDINIWEIYKKKPEKDAVVNELGIWSLDNGLQLTSKDKWTRRKSCTLACF